MTDAVVSAIAVQGLAKRFGEVQAVAEVSFEVRQGELFGFLGVLIAVPLAAAVRLGLMSASGRVEAAERQ